jgi:hypothetical protein
MERDPKVWDTATLLLERYGQNAPEIAQGWSRELTERPTPPRRVRERRKTARARAAPAARATPAWYVPYG